jgi:galactose-1-phosphate uridylyltransferase
LFKAFWKPQRQFKNIVCLLLSSTAEDTFGRLEHHLSYTAANTFKYDRWHTLIVSRNHDTLHLSENEIVDMFELAQEWFRKAHAIEPMYACPEMIWDAMPKSGASQMHTHLQASLGSEIYYGNIERTRQGARSYAQTTDGRNYFNDYLYIHQALGLTIPVGKAQIVVHLVRTSLSKRHRKTSDFFSSSDADKRSGGHGYWRETGKKLL